MIVEEKIEEGWPKNTQTYENNTIHPGFVVDVEKKPTALRAVFRTANILTCLSYGVDSVTEIANICKLNKSIIHRLLQAMCEAGLTTMDPISHRYYIGPLVAEISSNPYVTHENLISCAINEMRALSDFCGESIGLSVMIGLQSVTLYEMPSTFDLKIVGKKKIVPHLHAGAQGKVLLSQLNNKDLKIALLNLAMEPMTEHTTTFEAELIAQLKQIRHQGNAVSYGERIEGAMCLSAPINNYILPASVSILGPEIRVKPRANEVIARLMESVDRIRQNLVKVNKIK
jgi:IclR family transcriptional regulator, KDG regulon repressor